MIQLKKIFLIKMIYLENDFQTPSVENAYQ